MSGFKIYVLKHSYHDNSGHSLLRAYLSEDRANADLELIGSIPGSSGDIQLVAVDVYGARDSVKPPTNSLRTIDSAPRDGTFILLAGSSGYSGTPLRFEAGRWSTDYKAWVSHSNDRFTDGGSDATYWMPIPGV